MVLLKERPLPAWTGTGPRLAIMAGNEEGPDKTPTATASLFDGPASRAPDRIRNGMWLANTTTDRLWGVVFESAITLSATANTGQATNISHSTFMAGSGTKSGTYDYWAFTASGHRYMLSYARSAAAKNPDAATFFATAMSCPEPTHKG